MCPSQIRKPLTKAVFVVASLFLLVVPSLALETSGLRDTALLPSDGPGGAFPVFSAEHPTFKPNPDWIVRTGYKKGIIDHVLEEELRAGPDAAVLRSGFFEYWPELLGEFREPSVYLNPEDVAGKRATKPLLIIPSGALAGLGDSEFFKIGLAEYVRTGGVIICFAQQTGEDLAALPVPAGSKIMARGWAQDSGPLFQSSRMHSQHPILSGPVQPNPAVETDGYITSYPINTRILLSRTDGFPTLLAYPFGNGFVVVTTLFSDVAYGQGTLESEEKALLHNMVRWAKGPGQTKNVSPGERIEVKLKIAGTDQVRVSTINVVLFGPGMEKKTLPVHRASDNRQIVPFSFAMPTDSKPGMYHIEYQLMDSAATEITPLVESDAGRFVIDHAPKATPLRHTQPPGKFLGQIRVTPSLHRAGSTFTIDFTIVPEFKSPAPEDFVARVAGQEKSFKLGQDIISLSIAVPGSSTVGRIPYIMYHASGKIMASGSIPVMAVPKSIVLDRPAYRAGDKAQVQFFGFGNGEATLTGFDQVVRREISGSGSIEMSVPPALSAGMYTLTWEFRHTDKSREQGTFPLTVGGNRFLVRGISFEKRVAGNSYTVKTVFRVQSPQRMNGLMILAVRGPEGTLVPVMQEKVSFSEGDQSIPLTFTFKPKRAGIHELVYRILESPGDARGTEEQGAIASGRHLFDLGESAVLGMTTGQPVYYDTQNPIEVSVLGYCADKSKLLLELDGKKIKKEPMKIMGPCGITAVIPPIRQGYHTLRATMVGEKAESVREYRFLYGALLPDLVAHVQFPELTGIVAPVAVTVRNQGKKDSQQVRLELYDGDPLKSGVRIGKTEVPALPPGSQIVTSIPFRVSGKTGSRMLYAVVDPNDRVMESNEANNTASTGIRIPSFILTLTPQKSAYHTDEQITFTVRATNVTSHDYKSAVLDIKIIGPTGTAIASESVTLPELAPEIENQFDRTITLLAPLSSGGYQTAALLSSDKPLASTGTKVTILPTLSLTGTLEGTATTATLCNPLSIQYKVRRSGNLIVNSGHITVDILKQGGQKPVATKQFPVVEGARKVLFERLDLSPGQYTIRLHGTASNTQYGMQREFNLAEQPLTLSPPIDVKREAIVLPRVLILTGKGESAARKAILDKILKQAFDHEAIYHTITDDAAQFMNDAKSGKFNVYVLLEQDEMIPDIPWLRNSIEQGSGLLLIGTGERSRSTAESFGFSFGKALSEDTRMLSITPHSRSTLVGTLPVCGKILPAEKKGAVPVAVLSTSRESVALIAPAGKGKVLLAPFSIILSSMETGASSLYSAVLSSAVQSVQPESDIFGGSVFSMEISVSSTSSPVKMKLVETLPAGSSVLWANPNVKPSGNTLMFELTADKNTEKLLYLYQALAGGEKKTRGEVFYECKGRFVSQGNVE